MRSLRLGGCAIAAATMLLGLGTSTRAQVMIVGNDQKPKFDDGKVVMQPSGHDTLSIIDMSNPASLRIVATIPLDNTIVGPPTNLAITPKGELALVANSVNGVEKDGKWDTASDNRLFVVDLKANPPAVITTLNLGKKPSGMAINNAGTMTLVANRDDGTVSVLSINGKEVKVADTVTIGAAGDSVSAVAIAPDGKTALAVKSNVDKVAILAIDNGKVTYDKKNELPANNFPYNVAITPNGKIALIANTGAGVVPTAMWIRSVSSTWRRSRSGSSITSPSATRPKAWSSARRATWRSRSRQAGRTGRRTLGIIIQEVQSVYCGSTARTSPASAR